MNQHPPKGAIRFLRWYCKEDFVEEIEGNLLEVFESRLSKHPKRIRLWFYWQVLLHFRPDYIKPNPIMSFFSKSLLKHHLLISLHYCLLHTTHCLLQFHESLHCASWTKAKGNRSEEDTRCTKTQPR